MFDVVTFGSATQDIFIKLPEKDIKAASEIKKNGQFFCLPLGGKVLVEEIQYFSGGGGTNVACSLANLGFKIAYFGKVGDDSPAKIVLADLAQFKVNTQYCLTDKTLPTAVSFVVLTQNERTILLYQGACHFLTKQEVFGSGEKPRPLPKTKWIYIAPLYEQTAELFLGLINLAKASDIKVAVNPSIFQIEQNNPDFKIGLSKVDVLFLNQTEAGILANNPNGAIKDLLKEIGKLGPGIVVITQGDLGAMVFDGQHFYQSGVYKVPVEDKTGAGDSFASGFMAGLLAQNNIEYSCQLGMVNSAKNISVKGAKAGLLGKSELKLLPNVDIVKERAF